MSFGLSRLTSVLRGFSPALRKIWRNSAGSVRFCSGSQEPLHRPLLSGTVDRFGGVTVRDVPPKISEEEFTELLRTSLSVWRSEGRVCVWLPLSLALCRLCSPAALEGFTFHHARGDSALLSLWLAPGADARPAYATHQVGVAGAVLDESSGKVLVVQDRNKETGVRSEFLALLSLRQQHLQPGAFGMSDMYLICRMRPLSHHIQFCPHECLRCEWMDLRALTETPDTTPITRRVARLLLFGLEHGFREVDLSMEQLPSVSHPTTTGQKDRLEIPCGERECFELTKIQTNEHNDVCETDEEPAMEEPKPQISERDTAAPVHHPLSFVPRKNPVTPVRVSPGGEENLLSFQHLADMGRNSTAFCPELVLAPLLNCPVLVKATYQSGNLRDLYPSVCVHSEESTGADASNHNFTHRRGLELQTHCKHDRSSSLDSVRVDYDFRRGFPVDYSTQRESERGHCALYLSLKSELHDATEQLLNPNTEHTVSNSRTDDVAPRESAASSGRSLNSSHSLVVWSRCSGGGPHLRLSQAHHQAEEELLGSPVLRREDDHHHHHHHQGTSQFRSSGVHGYTALDAMGLGAAAVLFMHLCRKLHFHLSSDSNPGASRIRDAAQARKCSYSLLRDIWSRRRVLSRGVTMKCLQANLMSPESQRDGSSGAGGQQQEPESGQKHPPLALTLVHTHRSDSPEPPRSPAEPEAKVSCVLSSLRSVCRVSNTCNLQEFTSADAAAENLQRVSESSVPIILNIIGLESAKSGDLTMAFSCFLAAAQHGYGKAQFNVGVCFERGRGVHRDVRKALEFYRRAADSGHTRAQFRFAKLLLSHGGQQSSETADSRAALNYLHAAADAGLAQAQVFLAVLLSQDPDCDEQRCLQYFRRAAESGHADALRCLAQCYETGFGVSPSQQMASNTKPHPLQSSSCQSQVLPHSWSTGSLSLHMLSRDPGRQCFKSGRSRSRGIFIHREKSWRGDRSAAAGDQSPAVMALHKPPLRRSASTVESTSHSATSLTPPTSLNLRSSLNQQLNCDTIKEGVVSVSKETQSSKGRQKHAFTNMQNAMGFNQNPAPMNQNPAPKPTPTKSASSSSLYSSSLPFSTSNTKLAKNGTNLQLKEEQLDLNKNQRRRTRSFVQYRPKYEEMICSVRPKPDIENWLGKKWPEEKEEETKQHNSNLDNQNMPAVEQTPQQQVPEEQNPGEGDPRLPTFENQCEVKQLRAKLENQNWVLGDEKQLVAKLDTQNREEETQVKVKHLQPILEAQNWSEEKTFLPQLEKQDDQAKDNRTENRVKVQNWEEETTVEATQLHSKLDAQDWAEVNRVKAKLLLPKMETRKRTLENQVKDETKQEIHYREEEKQPNLVTQSSEEKKNTEKDNQLHPKPEEQNWEKENRGEMENWSEDNQFLSDFESQKWARENRVEVHLTLPQKQLLQLNSEEEESPEETMGECGQSVRMNQEQHAVQAHHKELDLQMNQEEDTFRTNFAELALQPRPTLLKCRPQDEKDSEDEDSSWTTLSQESPSAETPLDTGVWGEPPRAQEFFWRLPAETPPPVASDVIKEAGPRVKSMCLPVPCTKAQSERPSSIVSDSSVEPLPSSGASSPSSASLCPEAVGGALRNNHQDLKETCEREKQDRDWQINRLSFGARGGPYSFINHRAHVASAAAESSVALQELHTQVFAVQYLGWLQVRGEDLQKNGRLISECIRQLKERERRRKQKMLLLLKGVSLTLMDPTDHAHLFSQPISCIRLWGGGRGISRDFAYVAREQQTCVLKCHVFECEAPAETLTSSFQQICSKSFRVLYLGKTSVLRPIGMDMINGAIENLLSSTGKEDWTPATLNVANDTITVSKEKEEDQEVLVECRVRFLSFMGVGRDAHSFGFIMDSGSQHFLCHVFWCEPNAASVSEAVQSACVLRYQQCVCGSSSSSSSNDSVSRRVSSSLKRGVQSIIDSLRRRPGPQLPSQ
ncbi:hypothetical protein DNTS_000641 [Danionella cerebrum]|uniref:PID domain-containing protein n=1 Tax=Danionella cerebrum TaxID=2873325 RepID=A0A553PUP2_9TELE|nr:hypothetical protein DNTS_000641 [Danionella translucida]